MGGRALIGVPPVIPTVPIAPSSLSGLIGWWDASITASLTLSGSNVTAIADQSGTSHNLSNAGGGTVTYSATGFNSSYPAWTFPNSGTGLLYSTPMPMTGGSLTLWYVGTLGVGASSIAGRIISYAAGAGSDDFNNAASFSMGVGSPFTSVDFNRNNTHAGASGISASPAGHRFIVTIDASGNMTFYVDGVAGTPTGVSTGTWASNGEIMLGREVGFNADYWYGTQAEVGMATGFSDSTTVAGLDLHLKNKWGL